MPFAIKLAGAALAFSWPGLARAADAFDAALQIEDECGDDTDHGPDAACSLNALQLRGVKKAIQADSPEKTDATKSTTQNATAKHPEYCKSLKEDMRVPWCEPTSSCDCKGFCAAKVAPDGWAWNQACCACEPLDKTLGADAEGGGRSSPAYCEYIPAGIETAFCNKDAGSDGDPDAASDEDEDSGSSRGSDRSPSRSTKTCECSDYCSSVPVIAWEWDPNCCGCNDNGHTRRYHGSKNKHNDDNDDDDANRPDRGSSKQNHPEYCEYVPTGVSTRWCYGSRTCSCLGYCADTPSVAWSWDPNCCGCTSSDEGKGAHEPTHIVVSGKPKGDLDQPLYCQQLPLDVESPYCVKGKATCSCRLSCTHSVLPSQWGWDPQCCGCDPDDAPALDKPGDEKHRGALDQPVYCRNLPSGVSSPWCEEGKKSCGCADYCIAAVIPSQWSWDPQCCGCDSSDEEGDREPGSPRHGPDVPVYCPAALPGLPVPAWCEGGAGSSGSRGSCSCELYCETTVLPALWALDPNCCKCDAGGNEGGESSTSRGSTRSRRKWKPLHHPVYCDQLLSDTTVPWCEGKNTCKCEDYCLLAVGTSQWGYDPNCCGCNEDDLQRRDSGYSGSTRYASIDGGSTSESAQRPEPPTTPSKVSLLTPAFCTSLAASTSVKACTSPDGGCQCSGICSSVPEHFWLWNPGCCGC